MIAVRWAASWLLYWLGHLLLGVYKLWQQADPALDTYVADVLWRSMQRSAALSMKLQINDIGPWKFTNNSD